jgi:hypothetical protein
MKKIRPGLIQVRQSQIVLSDIGSLAIIATECGLRPMVLRHQLSLDLPFSVYFLFCGFPFELKLVRDTAKLCKRPKNILSIMEYFLTITSDSLSKSLFFRLVLAKHTRRGVPPRMVAGVDFSLI